MAHDCSESGAAGGRASSSEQVVPEKISQSDFTNQFTKKSIASALAECVIWNDTLRYSAQPSDTQYRDTWRSLGASDTAILGFKKYRDTLARG